MASILNSLGYNVGGQFFARLVSFLINMYLLRVVDPSIIGLVNVRLMLLFNTLLFLTREPFRKSAILKNSVEQFINIIWLSPLLCVLLSLLLTPLWVAFSSSPIPLPILFSFVASAVLETLAEPFAVVSLRFSLHKHFAISQALLISLNRVFVLIGILATSWDHLVLMAVAQVLSSFAYLFFHVFAFWRYISKPETMEDSDSKDRFKESFKIFEALLPSRSFLSFAGFDRESIAAVLALLGHSILKQFLTGGSAFVMTFTRLLTLEQQAVYDAVERLGSLASRMILTPMEETASAIFSNAFKVESSVFNKNTDSHDTLIRAFRSLLQGIILCGLTVCLFGVPYSPIAVDIYGGEVMVQNGGAYLLSTYAVYILISAVNGVTECFAFATMNSRDIFSHGGFMFFSAALHFSLSFFLCSKLAAIGFILANMFNMATRIIYSWRHIKTYLGSSTPSVLDFIPQFSTSVLMAFVMMLTSFSYLLFGTTAGVIHKLTHLSIGGALFIFLSLHIYYEERPFVEFNQKKKVEPEKEK